MRSVSCRTGGARIAQLPWARAASGRALRAFLQRHAPEGGACRRADPRSSPDHPGRTADRPRCRLGPPRQGIAAAARPRRLHSDSDHAHSRSRRAHGGSDRRHRVGPAGCRRYARRVAASQRRRGHQPGRHVRGAGRRRGRRRMTSTASLAWVARHEIRLARRDFVGMLTGGRRGRARNVALGLVAFAIFMHLPAYAVVGRFADVTAASDKATLIVIMASILLAWALMLSQAMESVTRVFYARADLDLIMSSPIALSNVFSVRIAAIALTVIAMALLLSTPFVDVLV